MPLRTQETRDLYHVSMLFQPDSPYGAVVTMSDSNCLLCIHQPYPCGLGELSAEDGLRASWRSLIAVCCVLS
jgi:hypothetical protein